MQVTNEERFKSAIERRAEYIKYRDFCKKQKLFVVDEFDWLALQHKEELKPCPFCDHTDIRMRQNNTKDVWYIFCNKCGCSTGGDVVRDMAIAAWNRRAK